MKLNKINVALSKEHDIRLALQFIKGKMQN